MHYQLQAPVAARDPAGRTSVYGLKIPTIGFVSLHAYACPNVNYEVSYDVGQLRPPSCICQTVGSGDSAHEGGIHLTSRRRYVAGWPVIG